MSDLDILIEHAYASAGGQDAVNKFYVRFFQTIFYMPAIIQPDSEEPFYPLYLTLGEQHFIVVFDSFVRFDAWGRVDKKYVDYVEIRGEDVIRGLSDQSVYLCLNPGEKYYKEFSPEEITRLKMMLSKINQLRKTSTASLEPSDAA